MIFRYLLRVIFSLMSCCVLSSGVSAEDKPNLVLLPVVVSSQDQEFISEYGSALQQGLQQRYTVFYGSKVEKELEKEYGKIDCDTETCNQNVAIAFNGELIADGSVKKTSKGYVLKLVIKNVFSDQVIETETQACFDCDELMVINKLKAIGAADSKAIAAVSNAGANTSAAASYGSGERAILLFDTSPSGASVLINNQPVGQTPYQGLNHEVGDSLEVLLVKNGFEPYSMQISLEESLTQLDNIRLAKRLTTGKLILDTDYENPSAEIFLNGESLGKPPVHKEVPSGSHKLFVIANENMTDEEDIDINPGETVSVQLNVPNLPYDPEILKNSRLVSMIARNSGFAIQETAQGPVLNIGVIPKQTWVERVTRAGDVISQGGGSGASAYDATAAGANSYEAAPISPVSERMSLRSMPAESSESDVQAASALGILSGLLGGAATSELASVTTAYEREQQVALNQSVLQQRSYQDEPHRRQEINQIGNEELIAEAEAEIEKQDLSYLNNSNALRSIENSMVTINGGSFEMGDLAGLGDSNEYPVHVVYIESFKISRTEVTWAQYLPCIDEGVCSYLSDEGWGKGHRPVTNVSWLDIETYINWLNKKTNRNYRLPSEAEWEYVARADTISDFSWGDDHGSQLANCNNCGSKWDGSSTSPVGSFDANSWGVYDMHGNVSEWVKDCWNDSYDSSFFSAVPEDGSAWESGQCQFKVLRGGSWQDNALDMRASARNKAEFEDVASHYGFRLAESF